MQNLRVPAAIDDVPETSVTILNALNTLAGAPGSSLLQSACSSRTWGRDDCCRSDNDRCYHYNNNSSSSSSSSSSSNSSSSSSSSNHNNA
jgi:hypothetical protein